MKRLIVSISLLAISSFAHALTFENETVSDTTIQVLGSRPLDELHAAQAFRDKYYNNLQPVLKERMAAELGCKNIKIKFQPYNIAGKGTAQCDGISKIVVDAVYGSSMNGWSDIAVTVKAFEVGRKLPYTFTFLID